MELRHLRYFVAVAEELHFSRAAARIGIEQSPLSRAIRELEADLGVTLLTRSSRATRITRAGELFLCDARRILNDVKRARVAARTGVASNTQWLRIGVSPNVVQPKIARLLARTRMEEPSLDLQVLDLPTAQQFAALEGGALDIGIALLTAGATRLRSDVLWTDSLVAVLPAGHALARGGPVGLITVLSQPSVICDTEIRTLLNEHVNEGGLGGFDEMAMVSSCGLSMLLELAASGLGVGLALTSQLRTLRRLDVEFCPLDGSAPVLTTYLRTRRDLDTDILQRFLTRARSIA